MRKAVAVAATGALLLGSASAAFADHTDPMDTGVCPPPGGDESFEDIDDGTFADLIECMGGYGITEGYTDGEYKPDLDITRAQMAQFIYELVETAAPGTLNSSAPDAFDDDDNSPFETAINALADAGIIQGTGGDNYSPARDVKRGEMAAFIHNAIEAVTGNSLVDSENSDDDTNGNDDTDAFTDDDGNIFEDLINAIAAEHIVSGTGGDEYDPQANVNRGQMAAFIMQAAGYLATVGEWAPTEDAGNQAFTVTPGDEATNPTSATEASNEGRHAYTVSDPQADTTHTLALVPADNITVEDGTVSFADGDEGNDGEADDLGETAAHIEQVNGLATDRDDVQTTTPENGEITFAIDSEDAASVVPVVFFDEDEDGELDLNEDGTPTDAEAFGIGGEKTWFDEAADPTTGTETVEFVNEEDNLFDTTEGGRYFYGADDIFQVGTDCTNVDQSEFEQQLSEGDVLNGADTTYVRSDEDGNSTFCIQDASPTSPTTVTADRSSATSIDVGWSGETPDEPDAFNVYRYTNQDDAGENLDTTCSTDLTDYSLVTEVEGTANTYEDAGLEPDTAYCYTVTAVQDDDEADPAAAAGAMTLAEGEVADIQSVDARVANDAPAGTFDETGTVSAGDVFEIEFNQGLANISGDDVFRIVDSDDDQLEIDCSATGISCASEGTDTGSENETLTVTLDDPTVDYTDGGNALDYDVTIDNATGFEDEDGESSWSPTDDPDNVLDVDEDTTENSLEDLSSTSA